MSDPAQVQRRLEQALALHQHGNLEQAARAYREILAVSSEHPDALHLLGVLMDQQDQLDDARSLIERAIAISPQGVFHLNLGNVLRRLGQFNGAITAWQRAAELSPELAAESYANIAALLCESPTASDEATGARVVATAAARTHANPTDPAAWIALAVAQYGAGQSRAAIASAREACRLAPEDARQSNYLGWLLMQEGRADEAIPVFRAAAGRLSTDASVLVNLAAALGTIQDDLSEAVALCRRAIELDANFHVAHETLATLMRQAGHPAKAVVAAGQAVALATGSAPAHEALGSALFDLGRTDEAVAAFHRAIELEPARAATYSNLLMVMHYQNRFEPADVFAEHLRWAARYADPIIERELRRSTPYACDRNPDRALRIGYVSGDFRHHPVTTFFEPLLEQHACRGEVEVFLYSNTSLRDDVTERLAKQATAFRDIVPLSDDEAAQLVRDDRIDILVDLAGHTARNRLLLLARKPAPVQVSYIGYWNTTGMRAIDYRLTDAWNDPPGLTEQWWIEQLVRLPGGAWCVKPPAGLPPVAVSPAKRDGFVTFISTNKMAKVSDAMLGIWRKILERTDRARLLVVTGEDDGRVRNAFKGIDPARYELLPRTSFQEYLKLYHRADVLLDVAPHNGHTTSVDALWMGVPVLTLAGQIHCSRLGASLLSSIGLNQFICESSERYIETAISLEDRIDELAELRRSLRDRLRASPLTDAPRLARAVEAAYRAMWREYVARA